MMEQDMIPAPRHDTYLLRGGLLITMDDRLGDLTGDILVAEGRIREVAPRIDAATPRSSTPPTP